MTAQMRRESGTDAMNPDCSGDPGGTVPARGGEGAVRAANPVGRALLDDFGRPALRNAAARSTEAVPRPLAADYAHFAHNERIARDVTLLVPVYNTPAGYLDECLRSIFRQIVRPCEIGAVG